VNGELDHISQRAEHLYNRFIRGGSLKTFLKGFYGLLAFVILLVIDLVAHSLKTLQGPSLDLVRTFLQGVALYYWGRALATMYFRHKDLSFQVGKPEASTIPVKGLRWFTFLLVIGCVFAFLPNLFILQLTADSVAKSPSTIVSISLINAVWFAGASLVIWSFVKMIYLWQHTREVQMRLALWFVPILLFSIYNYLFVEKIFPNDEAIYTIIHLALRSLIIFSTLFLWYRIPWIPHISSTAKNKVLIFSLTGFLLTVAAFFLYSTDIANDLMRNYAIILHSVIGGFFLGLASYFGLIFFNALFTLSSTELVERRQAEVQSLAKLTRFSSNVLTSDLLLDIPKLADQITILAREATKSDCAWLELTMRPVIGASVSEEMYRSFDNISAESALAISNDTFSSAKDVSISKGLVEMQQAIVVNSKEFLPDLEAYDSIKPHSLLAIPLMHKAQMRGALYVAKEKEYGFDDEDVTVLTAFSDIASLAFDTARLLTDSIEKQKFDGELRAARVMQQSLLPSAENIPKHPEYQIDALSIPAYEVGGDYYDFLNLWDGSQLVITGDVSGKGISASIFMAEVKGIVQALAPQQATIRELLVATNDAVMRNVSKNATSRSFVTLAAVSIKDGYVHYCRAGHTPLLHFSANGEFSYHQPKGMGIGFVKRALFDQVLEEDEFMLSRGETLVLFSDGITEIRNEAGEELGYKRFAEIVRSARFEDEVEKMKDLILKNVLDFSGAMNFFDDATFVIIRRV
jgi:sigma-B regulation protein RsbU (phosphoserine phosphatase)